MSTRVLRLLRRGAHHEGGERTVAGAARGKAVQVDPVSCDVGVVTLKALGFNQLKAYPFQSSGFRCQPVPLLHRGG